MKRTYIKPQIQAVLLPVHVMFLSNSIIVNEYNTGEDIDIGDEDED